MSRIRIHQNKKGCIQHRRVVLLHYVALYAERMSNFFVPVGYCVLLCRCLDGFQMSFVLGKLSVLTYFIAVLFYHNYYFRFVFLLNFVLAMLGGLKVCTGELVFFFDGAE